MNPELIPAIYQTNPEIKFCNLFNGLSSLWDYSLHKHPYIELIYRKKGFGRTELLDDTQNFTFFDTIVYPVECWHQDKFEASASNEAYCLWIDLPDITLDQPLQVQDHHGKLEFLFQSIFDEHQKSNASPELLSLLTRSLLIQILLFSKESEPSPIDRAIQYLKTNMTRQVTLDELSASIYMSKSYLVKQFKKETGCTVIEYLNSLRIDTAKMLLITTTKTVEEISYAVGFDSPKYFFRIFKKMTGVTPAKFSKQHFI